jgi:CHAT domain-containing protein
MLDTAQAAARPSTGKRLRGGLRKRSGLWSYVLFALTLLLCFALQDADSVDARADYDQARRLFLTGHFETSQEKAEQGYRRFHSSDPQWARRFQLLEAETMLWRGMFSDSLELLAAYRPAPDDNEGLVRELTIESAALAHQPNLALAGEKLSQAEGICRRADLAACGDVLRARGVFYLHQGDSARARESFLDSLHFAVAHGDRWLEAGTLMNLGGLAVREEHFDEALDWSNSSLRLAAALGAEDVAQVASGNLGYAYLRLGDTERSLDLFLEAEKRAAALGDIGAELNWLITAGNIYVDSGKPDRAQECYRRALAAAEQIKSTQDTVNSLESLVFAAIQSGDLDAAGSYLARLTPLLGAGSDRLDQLDVLLAQGKLDALRGRSERARAAFEAVDADRSSQVSMRLDAEHELARLLESGNDVTGAEAMYRRALATFESARSELTEEDSKLPFLANAESIYDDYIHLLVAHGRSQDALAVADRSRARTLAQDLGIGAKNSTAQAGFDPVGVARVERATLLFYWLGRGQSYLWAVTGQRSALFTLPAQARIAAMAERYSQALLGPEDPLDAGNEDGRALYDALIAPAASMIPESGEAIVFADGALSRLNFETLLAPGPGRLAAAGSAAPLHYWIDDVTLLSAPSISMLSAPASQAKSGERLLLLGDAISPGPDYPELPMAGLEMKRIEAHFSPAEQTVFARADATPAAYLESSPGRFSYIHFVTHGVASRTDPLDSAIILSRASAGEDSFKLHARDIIRHAIDARLVTISACYGSGERAFAGEGLVGLSWAFLRAGAHNVIGALWEASDESTPQLMDRLYEGLKAGSSPAVALHRAKLALLHGPRAFRKPFYWASFQVYAGH